MEVISIIYINTYLIIIVNGGNEWSCAAYTLFISNTFISNTRLIRDQSLAIF